MQGTIDDETVHVTGSGRYDRVECESFRVDGSARVTGGVSADEASIDGSATVGDDLDAGEVDVDGKLVVEGATRAGAASVDGSGTFRGDASVDGVVVDGSLRVGGNLDAHEVEVDGKATVDGTVVAAAATVDGSVAVGGPTEVTDLEVAGSGAFEDVNAGSFVADGRLDAGEVSAGTFEFVVRGDSEAVAVEGDEVAVRPAGAEASLVGKLLHRGDPIFEVGAVTGRTVDLDAVRAETVVGERVALGPDADVGVVYADDLDADDGATVGEVRPYEEY